MDLRITVNNTEVFNYTAHEFKFIPGENDAYQLIGLFGRGSSRLADFIDYLNNLGDNSVKTIQIEEDNFGVTFECVDWKYQVYFASGNKYRHENIYFVAR